MSLLNILTQKSFTVISNPLAEIVGNDAAVLMSVIATKQDYFTEGGKMTTIDGEPYFFFLLQELAKASRIHERTIRRTVLPKLEENGFLIVKRNGPGNKNYYRVNAVKVLELFQQQDYKTATDNYIKVQMEMNREEEEVKKEAAQLAEFYKKENEAIQAMLSEMESKKSAAAIAEAAEAVDQSKAKLQDIGDMLPTGMDKLQQQPAAEPEPAPFVQVKEPARPAPKKKEAAEQAELIRSVWRESKFRLINDYLLDTRDWTELFVAEICTSLEMFIDPEIVSIVDIDAGILDYINAPTKVSRPSKYIARCISRQAEERFIKMGIDIGGLDMRVKSAKFIEQLRTIRPNDPAVLAYDRETEAEKAAIFA